MERYAISSRVLIKLTAVVKCFGVTFKHRPLQIYDPSLGPPQQEGSSWRDVAGSIRACRSCNRWE